MVTFNDLIGWCTLKLLQEPGAIERDKIKPNTTSEQALPASDPGHTTSCYHPPRPGSWSAITLSRPHNTLPYLSSSGLVAHKAVVRLRHFALSTVTCLALLQVAQSSCPDNKHSTSLRATVDKLVHTCKCDKCELKTNQLFFTSYKTGKAWRLSHFHGNGVVPSLKVSSKLSTKRVVGFYQPVISSKHLYMFCEDWNDVWHGTWPVFRHACEVVCHVAQCGTNIPPFCG